MQLWFVSVVPKYLKFDTFLRDLLAIFILCFCRAFLQRDINIYLAFFGFTSRLTSLLASNRVSVFFCMESVFFKSINVISTGQKLTCPIEFQSFLVLMDPRGGIFQSKLENRKTVVI
jgi:hypothetical protein